MRFWHPIFTIVVVATAFTLSGTSANNPKGKSYLLVANKGEATLGIVDPDTGRQIAKVAEGGVTGHEVIASPDGKLAFVPIYGDSGVGKPGSNGQYIAVIDIATRKLIRTMDFGRGVRPHCPMFGPKDSLLYVTTELENSISIIDPHTYKIVGSITTGQPESHMLAISPDGKRGYTANVSPGTVSVLDMEARKPIATIEVASEIQRISVSTDGSMAFTSDQKKPQLAVIDTAANNVKSWIPLPATGYGSASTPDGRWLVVALPSANKVAAIDLHEMKVAHLVDVPSAPQEVLIRPDGNIAYASCDKSHKVAAIQTANWTVDRLIDVGADADGLAWASSR